MLRGRVVPGFLGLSLSVLVFGASGAGASTGTVTADVKAGTATWHAVVSCNPGDHVEIDVFVLQGSSDASAESFFVCPASGEEQVSASTGSDEDDRLHPGRADLHVVRTDYVFEDDDLIDVTTTESRLKTTLRPDHT